MVYLPESLVLFILSVAGTIIAGYLFSWVVGRTLGRVNKVLGSVVARFGSWTIYVVGFLFALGHLNLRVEVLLMFFGVVATLFLLGLRDVIPNIVAMHVIEMYRPYRVGDWIEIDGKVGRVIDINDMYTIVFTADHERLYVPNNLLLKKNFANITKSEGFDVTVLFEAPLTGDLVKNLTRLEDELKSKLKSEVTEGDLHVMLTGLSTKSATIAVRLRVSNPQRVAEIKSRILREAAEIFFFKG